MNSTASFYMEVSRSNGEPILSVTENNPIPHGTFCFKENPKEERVYYLPHQKEVKDFYLQHSIQILVAMIILMNFVTAAVQAQILPHPGSTADKVLIGFEWFYVYAFLVELLINMYGHYWWEFWQSGWNMFDFFIVVISLLAMYF